VTTRPVVVGPGDGETVQGPAGGPLTFKVRGAETAGALTALENVIAPGDGPPLHTHRDEDEAWYVLAGSLRFRLGDEEATAAAGSFLFVPRGVVHAFVNDGDEPARILVLFTPAGMERFFDEFAALEAFDPAAFGRIGATVGMQVVGPPLASAGHPRPAGASPSAPAA
jgi:quercetin dioxygenase-like cupin family protein